jgi:hypothetical protein
LIKGSGHGLGLEFKTAKNFETEIKLLFSRKPAVNELSNDLGFSLAYRTGIIGLVVYLSKILLFCKVQKVNFLEVKRQKT